MALQYSVIQDVKGCSEQCKSSMRTIIKNRGKKQCFEGFVCFPV